MSPPGDLSFHPDPPPADVRDHGEDLAALHHFVVVHTVRPLIRHAGAIVHDHATVGWSWRDVGMHVPIAVDARPRLECAALGGPALAGGESRDRQPEQKCAKREATHEGQAVDGLFASPGRRDRYRVLRNFPRATATIRFCTRNRCAIDATSPGLAPVIPAISFALNLDPKRSNTWFQSVPPVVTLLSWSPRSRSSRRIA